jgi:hypothetical protein
MFSSWMLTLCSLVEVCWLYREACCHHCVMEALDCSEMLLHFTGLHGITVQRASSRSLPWEPQISLYWLLQWHVHMTAQDDHHCISLFSFFLHNFFVTLLSSMYSFPFLCLFSFGGYCISKQIYRAQNKLFQGVWCHCSSINPYPANVENMVSS